MNVFCTFKETIIFAAFLLLPLVGFAQLEYYELVADEVFTYEVHSNPNQPTATSSHGTTEINYLGSSNFSVDYTAIDGYIGLDTIEIGYWENPWSYRLKGIVISIIPSKIEAVNDFASTGYEEDILIDVVSNDYASRGFENLQLTGIPIVNNGLASPESNTTILFRPDPGFSGVASFNYIVCDDLGTCATGTVSISVASNEAPAFYTTTYLSTTKNTILPIPLESDGFEIQNHPSNGSVVMIGTSVVEFEPNTDFVGADLFTMKRTDANGTIYRDFKIDVLATQNPNGVIFDDYAYTPINTGVNINVTENDLGNHFVTTFSQSNNGTVSKNDDGTMHFEPNNNFKGVATFTYKIGSAGNNETAKVYVEVANQAPAAEVFDIYIPKNIPKPIYYDIPIDQFYFTIADEADHGNIQYFDGAVDTEIYGFNIKGNNILVYTPDIDFVGIDEFEIQYCVTSNNHCQLSKIRMHVEDNGDINPNLVCTDLDCVWPGDGNNDGIVNMIDLLQLGMNFGEVGNYRQEASLEWYGQYAEDWGKTNFGSTIDAKYVDMNGNGMVTQEDIGPIDMWYGRTHNLTPAYNPFARNYPLYFDYQGAMALEDTEDLTDDFDYLVTYDIHLGSENSKALNMYGISFSFGYNTNFVDPSSVEVNFAQDSWMAFNSPVINHVENDETNGQVDIGYTRTSGFSISGNGKVATLSFIIEDDLLGFRVNDLARTIAVNNIYGIDPDGRMFELPAVSYELPVFEAPSENISDKDLGIFPNPTKDEINVYLSGLNRIEELAIFTTTGQQVFSSGKIETIKAKLNLQDLPDGMYIIRAQTQKGVISKKVQVAH